MTYDLLHPVQGEQTLKHIKREINKVLPKDKNMQLVYTETKPGIKFNVKAKTKDITI